MLILHIVATVLGISGGVLLAFKKVIACHLCWLVANVCWIAWCIGERDLLTGLTFTAYLGLTILGLYNWSRKEKK